MQFSKENSLTQEIKDRKEHTCQKFLKTYLIERTSYKPPINSCPILGLLLLLSVSPLLSEFCEPNFQVESDK